jgi:penicillin-binding protein 1A
MDPRKRKEVAAKATDITVTTLGDVLRLALKIVATALLIFITTGLLFTCIFAYYVKTCLTTDLDIRLEDFTLALSSTIWYTDANGEYQELITLSDDEDRIWVDYEDIPDYMWKAAVAIEDKRFFDHKGVDWYRTVGAFANMFLTMKNDFGGSTITQQLIKNVTKEDDITVQRKLAEIFRALEFEKSYTKEEILEWYLNVVYFGEGCNGVYTAAKTYFDKDVSDLSLAECAAIVGITNQPTKYDPFNSRKNNKERQETILKEMYDQGLITYEEYVEAMNEELVFARGENEVYTPEIYSYYVENVINDVLNDLQERKGVSLEAAQRLLYSGGYQIYACIDPEIQAIVDSVYEDVSQLPQSYYPSDQQLQSAIVILNPKDGSIVALSGGTGEKTGNFNYDRATVATRPPGSSFKPIAVYGPAFEYGLISQTTLVDDSPDIKLSGTTWYPRNAGGGNRGIITIRQGLISSLNTVSAQILDKLGPANSFEFLQTRLGVTSLVPSDMDYAPLALGQLTHGITVREMAQAYDAFANDGVFTYARTYTHITDSNGNPVLDNSPQTIVAFKENVAWNITNMLQAAVAYGTGSEASLGYTMPVAGKTGTTSDSCDRYFVGYTPYYVAAVWTGYDTPEPMYFYGNPAAQIWKKIMQPIHETLEYVDFPYPSIGGPTNIFGDLEEEEEDAEESPDASESPDVSGSPTPSASPSDIPVTSSPTPTDTGTPTSTPPVTPVIPTEPVVPIETVTPIVA